MDANGTRFHLLLSREDWADGKPALPTGISWHEIRPDLAEITLEPRLFRFQAAPNDRKPEAADRRGAGRDRFGNWYWIDETRRKIRVLSVGSSTVSDFWPTEQPRQTAGFGEFQPSADSKPTAPPLLSGLAVTEDHYLVVGVTQPKGLLVFDLHATGGPRQVLWPEDVAFAPHDMAARPGGGVWILDAENLCYWGLDRFFNVIGETAPTAPATPPDFQPLDGAAQNKPPAVFPSGFPLLASPPEFAPIALEALPDGTVAVLESGATSSRIARYERAARIGAPLEIAELKQLFEPEEQAKFQPLAYDLAFTPPSAGDNTDGRLYVAAAEGNQAFAFALQLDAAGWQAGQVKEFFSAPAVRRQRLGGGGRWRSLRFSGALVAVGEAKPSALCRTSRTSYPHL